MDIKESIYKIKGIAILSVLIAHTPLYATSIEGQFISRVYSTIGAIGVPIFLFISGYLFNKKDYTLREFLYKKIGTIIIPWFFCASIVYIISCYFGSSAEKINIISYIKFILGDGSLFYYMSILFLLYIGMFYIVENKTYLYIVICLSIMSIYLTAIGIFNNINLYLNPFNFAIYFTLGVLLKNKLNYIIKFSIKNKKRYYYYFLLHYL